MRNSSDESNKFDNKKSNKPRIAFFDFASCEGCQLQIANLEEELLGLVDSVEIVSFREVMKDHNGLFDIAFVEGSIQRPMDEKRLKAIRAGAKFLIALGTCASNGGVNKLRNEWDPQEARAEVYGKFDFNVNPIFDVGKAKAVNEVVEVDFQIWGCPVRKKEVQYYVNRLFTMPPHNNLELKFDIQSRNRLIDERSIIHYDPNKCVLCRRCDLTCNMALDVHAIGIAGKGPESLITTPFNMGLDNNNCIYCGQCITTCPVGALYVRSDVEIVKEFLRNKEHNIIFVIDPIGIPSCVDKLNTSEENLGVILKSMISALKENGVSHVVDYTPFVYLSSAAQAEFIRTHREPLFTSWCPGGHFYIERFFPKLSKYIHRETAPETLLMSTLKAEFGEEKVKVVLVTPCLAHKMNTDFDAIITAQELPRLLNTLEIQLDFHPSLGVTFDLDMGLVDKFITGGCSDYTYSLGILRAAYLGKYENLEAALTVISHDESVHELAFDSEEGFFNALVIEDMAKARSYLEGDIRKFNLIELYPCYRGCMTGGGQFPTVSESELLRRIALLKEYKGEIESPFEFTAQVISAYTRMKGVDA